MNAMDQWQDAAAAAAVFAVDPIGTGGIRVSAGAGPVRDHWLECLRDLLPPTATMRKIPIAVADERLLGGLDLAATLAAGRPVATRGLLAEADGGILLAATAERLTSETAARLNAALDTREVSIERDGISQTIPSAFGLVAFDEGIDDEHAPASLCDRLAFHIDLWPIAPAEIVDTGFRAADVTAARHRLPAVSTDLHAIEVLCHTAASLGVVSLRAPRLALRVARAMAALDGSETVQRAHVEFAVRLVLAPRATHLPQSAQERQAEPPETREARDERTRTETPPEDLVLAAAQAAIPPDLLKRLQDTGAAQPRKSGAGGQGQAKTGMRRGRPVGARCGQLAAGARIHVLETLRAAVPWQRLRRRPGGTPASDSPRLVIRRDDIRVVRFKQRSVTATIFVVDASGSAALQRLAEVKGAVNLLLADCYARRDEVALIAFRGATAELVLPPTRSLTLAKRRLAALPGGGGTPLSAAIVSATTVALAVRGKGRSPTVVLMTDGRANVSRGEIAGRAAAEAEAHEAARTFRATGLPAVVIDTSPRPQPQAARIAAEMQARYVALPYADAARLSQTVQANVRAG